MKDNTSIRLSKAIKKRLNDLKQYPRETYEDVVVRLLNDSKDLWEGVKAK